MESVQAAAACLIPLYLCLLDPPVPPCNAHNTCNTDDSFLRENLFSKCNVSSGIYIVKFLLLLVEVVKPDLFSKFVLLFCKQCLQAIGGR